MKFNIVVCGGTFDHFHKGHEALLQLAFSLGEKVVIGVTSDRYVKNLKFRIQNSKFIESFEKRKQTVLEFVEDKGGFDRVEVVKIDDLFGPTLNKNLAIDAIVVSENTKKGAVLINKKRKELDLKDLKILVAPFVNSQDGKIVASERIRNGEINREGKLYVNQLWLKKSLKLSENLRREFQKPFGVLLPEVKDSGDLSVISATVGDITTKKFNEFKFNQQVSVIDFKVKRQKEFSDIHELGFLGSERIIKVGNPAGTITSELFKTCLTIWNKEKVILLIEGEDDLAVLPLVLTAPLGATIFYGQPPLRSASFEGQASEGIVKVIVSEESKDRAYNLVSRLKPA